MSEALKIAERNAGRAGQTREALSKFNRDAFPLVAEMVAEARRDFGDKIKVRYASENGREIGRRGDPGVVATVIAKQTKKRGRA